MDVVRPSFFTQNLSTTHAADIRDRDQVFVPAGGGRTAFVDVLDVADVAAAALAEPLLTASGRGPRLGRKPCPTPRSPNC